MASGRQSRSDRLTTSHPGVWSTSSQDYVLLATQLFSYSAREAIARKGNASAYVFAGLPLLFSALRAFLIECNDGVYGVEADHQALARLANEPNELTLLQDAYGLPVEQLQKLSLLYEARNEIIHPSHRPSGTADSIPNYIRRLKNLGVLQTTNDLGSDYPWMFQLQSHRLFRFAFTLVEKVVASVIEHHRARDPHVQCPNLPTYAQYKQVDL